MVYNGRLPFPISSLPPLTPLPYVTASMQRTSIEFHRPRVGFLGSPDFHISPYSQPLLFVVSFSPPSYIPTYICLYLFRQLQQLREITGKPCGETEITDVSPACGAEIYGGVAVGSRRMRGWRRRKGRIRDREKDVGGRIGRREREGEDTREFGGRSEKGDEPRTLQSDSADPALLSRHANSTTAG